MPDKIIERKEVNNNMYVETKYHDFRISRGLSVGALRL